MQESFDKSLTIKTWAAEDRPREKLLLKGKSALTDAELLAILLGTGTASQSALDVAKKILQTTANSLDKLATQNVKDLTKVKGIGEAKAITIVAALELGRRRKELLSVEKPKIRCSRDVYDYICSDLLDLQHEEFWIILTNRSQRIIKKQQVSSGGVSGTVADPKLIFKLALDELASGIILVHNHPSGNAVASQSDILLTTKLKEGGKLLEIQVLDHIIVAGKGYVSFADEGLL